MKRVTRYFAAFSFLIVAAVFAGCGGSSVGITLSTPAAEGIDQGQQIAITATVTSDSTNSGVTWTCTGAACTTLTSSTTSATFTASGATGTATITATSVKQPSISKSVVVTVSAPPATTTTQTQLTAAPATAGQAYSFSLTASGGAGALTWTAAGLSDGLSLNASSRAITGTPTSKGTVTFTYTVKDSSAAGPLSSTSGSLTITVNNPPAPAITTTQSQVTAGTAGSAYSFKFQATGTGTLTWSATGLSDGLTLNTSNGTVSGTPTTPQTVSISLTVSDTYGQSSAATPFTITINPAPLGITTTSLPQGTIGSTYTTTNVAVTGGTAPFTWSVSSGSLPAGVSLNTSTGAISGTPTAAAVTSAVTVKVVDSSAPQMSATQNLTVVITLSVTTSSLPNAAIGTAYNATLAAEGGQPSYVWSVSSGSLPAGLVLNTSTGAISGTPANNATSASITVKVQDSATTQQSATQNLSISIPLTLETSTLPGGSIGTAYNQSVAAGGGTTPYTWPITSGSLPAGLSLNTSTGAITGTPANNSTSSSLTIQVKDSSSPQQTVSSSFTISIPLVIETTSLPSGTPNVAYSQNVAVGGGTTPYTWSITSGALPPPLTLNAATGAITGTPSSTDNGPYNFTVQVVDSTVPSPQTTTQNLSIDISALNLSSSAPSAATIGTAYNNTPATASGGTSPYTYSVASGSLPSGLNLNSSTGAITGTPSSSATDQSFSIKATDSSVPAQTATSSTLSILVNLVVTTTSPLPSGAIGVSYNQTINAEGGQPPYTFSVDAGGNPLPANLSLSSSGAITGTPTTAATTNNIIVDVSDSATSPQTAKPVYSITVATPCGSGSESLLNGQYAFLLTGFDNENTPEPALVGGVLTLNGSGSITAGTVDMNLNSTAGVQTNSVTSGTYSIGSDHRGCMAITTSAGTQNYRFSVGNITSNVASTGHMIDFDSTGPFTAGVLRKQDTTAFSTSKVTGKYAFGVSGPQNINSCNNSICGGKFGAVGVFNFSTGSVTGGEVDYNGNGSVDNNLTAFAASPVSINSGGSYTVGANGRGTLVFTPNGSSNAVNAVIYVVSATDVLVMNSDDQTQNSAFAGELLQQSGSFSTSTLSGNYILYTSSLNGASSTNVSIVRLNASGGNLTATIQQNSGGAFGSQSGSGTYTVASTGRSLWTLAGSSHNPVIYLVNSSEGFSLNANGGVESGLFQSQTGSPFSASSASGTYAFGTVNPDASTVSDSSGDAIFDGSLNISGSSDDNSGGFLDIGQTISQTYTIDSTGLGLSPSGCTVSSTSTTCNTIIYVISPTKAVVLDPTSTNPGIQTADK